MAVELKRSVIVAELKKGGSIKAIAERIGITIPLLKKAKDVFNKGLDKTDPKYINLRMKPKTEEMNFIDDSEEETVVDNLTTDVIEDSVDEVMEEAPSTTTIVM